MPENHGHFLHSRFGHIIFLKCPRKNKKIQGLDWYITLFNGAWDSLGLLWGILLP